MPVPSDNSLSNLSTTPGSNSPSGGENISTTDDYLRFIQSALKAGLTNGSNAITTGASVVIPSAGLTVRLSGNGTVTALTGGYDGRLLLVQVEGSITFTHSTSLQCPGSANLAVTAGDLLLAERRSSVWYLYNAGQTVAAALAAETQARQLGDAAESQARVNEDTNLQSQISAMARGICTAWGTRGDISGDGSTYYQTNMTNYSGSADLHVAGNALVADVAGTYYLQATTGGGVYVSNQGDAGFVEVQVRKNGAALDNHVLPLHNQYSGTYNIRLTNIDVYLAAGESLTFWMRGKAQTIYSQTCYLQARRW